MPTPDSDGHEWHIRRCGDAHGATRTRQDLVPVTGDLTFGEQPDEMPGASGLHGVAVGVGAVRPVDRDVAHGPQQRTRQRVSERR